MGDSSLRDEWKHDFDLAEIRRGVEGKPERFWTDEFSRLIDQAKKDDDNTIAFIDAEIDETTTGIKRIERQLADAKDRLARGAGNAATVQKEVEELERELAKEKKHKSNLQRQLKDKKRERRGLDDLEREGPWGQTGSSLGAPLGNALGFLGKAGKGATGGRTSGRGSGLSGGLGSRSTSSGSFTSSDRDPLGGGRESSWKPAGRTATVSVGDGSTGGSFGDPSGSFDDDVGAGPQGRTHTDSSLAGPAKEPDGRPSGSRGEGKETGDRKSEGTRSGEPEEEGGDEETDETKADDATNTRGTPNPMDDGTSLSGAGDPISAVVTFGATRLAVAQAGRYRGPRSDGALNDDSSLADADVDWSMMGFDPTIDPTPYAGAALAGGMGPAAIRDDYTGAVSATNGGGGSTGGLRPSAVGVGGGPILAFRPDMDSPTDRGKVDEASMLVDRFTTIPGASGDVPGSGGDPAAMRSSTPAVGGSGSTIGTIGGMALLGGAMVSINQGVGKVQPGAVAGTYRRK